MSRRKQFVAYDQAASMVPDLEFVRIAFDSPSAVLVFDRQRDEVLELLKRGAERSGPIATRQGFGLVLRDRHGMDMFIETNRA